jgi:hypothetical protein
MTFFSRNSYMPLTSLVDDESSNSANTPLIAQSSPSLERHNRGRPTSQRDEGVPCIICTMPCWIYYCCYHCDIHNERPMCLDCCREIKQTAITDIVQARCPTCRYEDPMLNLITPNAARGSRVVEHVLRNPALRARADGVRGRQQGQFVYEQQPVLQALVRPDNPVPRNQVMMEANAQQQPRFAAPPALAIGAAAIARLANDGQRQLPVADDHPQVVNAPFLPIAELVGEPHAQDDQPHANVNAPPQQFVVPPQQVVVPPPPFNPAVAPDGGDPDDPPEPAVAPAGDAVIDMDVENYAFDEIPPGGRLVGIPMQQAGQVPVIMVNDEQPGGYMSGYNARGRTTTTRLAYFRVVDLRREWPFDCVICAMPDYLESRLKLWVFQHRYLKLTDKYVVLPAGLPDEISSLWIANRDFVDSEQQNVIAQLIEGRLNTYNIHPRVAANSKMYVPNIANRITTDRERHAIASTSYAFDARRWHAVLSRLMIIYMLLLPIFALYTVKNASSVAEVLREQFPTWIDDTVASVVQRIIMVPIVMEVLKRVGIVWTDTGPRVAVQPQLWINFWWSVLMASAMNLTFLPTVVAGMLMFGMGTMSLPVGIVMNVFMTAALDPTIGKWVSMIL